MGGRGWAVGGPGDRPKVAQAIREELDRTNAEMVPPRWEFKKGPATRRGAE